MQIEDNFNIYSLSDAINNAILMHRDVHFEGDFQKMCS